MRSDSTLARWLSQVRQSLGSSASLTRNKARRERAVRQLRTHNQTAEPWLAEERLLLSAPAIVLSVTDATYTENAPPVTLDPAITANDPDADFITGAQVKITDYVMGQDQLSFTPNHGITGSFDNTTGILTLNGNATASQYASVLSSVQYQNLSENPTDLQRTLEYTITDTEPATSAPATLTLNLVPVADTPANVNATVDEDTLSAPIVLTPNPVDGTSVTHFQITGITGGALYQADGLTPINDGDFITLADATAGLKFQGNSNYFGPAEFKFQAATGNTPADLGGAKATAAITVDPVADTPADVTAMVDEDALSAPIVLSPNPVDGMSVTNYQITGITGGTLYQADGVTQINNGDFITAADAAAGVRFQGSANYFGPANFKFQAATGGTVGDLGGGLATANITVKSVNDDPTITGPGAQTVDEGTVLTFSNATLNPITINDVDAASNLLTVEIQATGPAATYTLGNTSGITFVQGTNGGTTPLIIQGTLTDLQAALNGLQVQPQDNGTLNLTLIVTDEALASDQVLVPITVNNVSPTLTLIGPAPNTVNEGDFVTVTGSATDPANMPTTLSDNDPLTYSWSVTKDGNAYTSGMGNVANFQAVDNGVYIVTMTVTDGDGGSDTETYTINVANVDPTLTLTGPASNTVNEGDFVTVTGSATDPANSPTTPSDNDPLTYVWSVTKDGNAYDSGVGNVANFQAVDNGVYIVTMTVTDGDGGSDTETYTINVANVPPTLTLTGPAPNTVNEGDFITVTGSATDPANQPTTPSDNDPLTYVWSVTKDGNAYTSGAGNVANFQAVDNGVYIVTMTVTDGDGGSDTETYTINVANVPPTLTLTGPAPNTVNEGDLITVTGSATDPANQPTTPTDNDPLTYTWSVTKDGNAYTSGAGNVANFQAVDNGVYIVTMTVTDGDGGSDTETYTINVANVPPVLTLTGPAPNTVNEGDFVTVTGSATDPANQPTTPTDNDPLTYTWFVTKDGNAYTSGAGNVANFQVVDNGVYIVTMTVTDGDGGSDTETYTINVANVPPVLTLTGPAPNTVNEGDFVTVTGSTFDPANPPTTPTDNDPLTYTWSVTKDGNAYTSGTGNIANFQVVDNGVYVVTMTVTDGDGGSDTETYTINVANVPPVLTMNGPATANEGDFVNVTGSTFDPANPPTTPSENDPLTYNWSVTKDGNAFTSGVGNVANFQVVDNGVYIVTMTVTDGDGGSDTETFTINVANVDPTLTLTGPAPNTVNEGDFVTVTGSATDPANSPTTPSDNDPLTYVWSVTKDGNAYDSGVGNVANFQAVDNGVYVVTMTVTDDDLGSDTKTYTINVANVAPTPTVTGDTTGFEGTPINLTASSTDPANMPTTPTDNDSVAYSWLVTRNGSFYSSGSGSSYTLTPNNEGTYVVTLTAADEDGGVQSTTHTIVVANVAPTATINATDIDGQFYTYVDVAVDDPGNDNISVLIVWGDINPDDYLNDPFLNGETATTRDFPTVSHRYLNAPNPQDPLAPVTITFFINDGTTTVVQTVVVEVTEQGIPAGGVYVTPEPEQIVLPVAQAVIEPPVILTQPAQQQVRNEEVVSREDQLTEEDARLVLHVVGPTGVEGPAVTLPDGLLKNLRSLFNKLPDGHYRVYLVQGESRRLVIEVFVRQGRAIDPAEVDQGTQERPPQAQPAAQEEPPRVMQAEPVGQAVPDMNQVGQAVPHENSNSSTNPSPDSDASSDVNLVAELVGAPSQAPPDLQNEPKTAENAEESGLASLATAGIVVGESWRRAARRQRAAAVTTGPANGEKIENTWSRAARRARQWKPR